MGAVKNLFVRIGGDASGAVNSFKNASKAAGSAKENIKKSSADTKRSIRDGFASSTPSIKAYTATIARTKEAHQAAVQNVERLSDKIAHLEDVYGTIKNATDGLDLSKSLASQISDTEKQLETINAKIVKTQTAISRIGNPRSASKAERLAALQDQLNSLIAESDDTAAHLSALDAAASRVGEENMGLASASGLKSLQAEIDATKNQLKTTQAVVDETGQKLKSLGLGPTLGRMLQRVGTAASQAARSGVSALGSGLKKLGGSAVRGLASLPGKLLGIGKNASAGCGGLQNMVRSIRNIGVVSLGLRVASGMFGQLRSVVSNYISENKALSKSVETMKMQLGEALAPAINFVMAALQRLMPVVSTISSAISSIFTVLFGKVSATSKAISKSADSASSAADSLEIYGFDQITKVSDDSSGGGGSSVSKLTNEQSALVQKLTNWIQQLKNAFVSGDWVGLGSLIGDSINKAFDALGKLDIGSKVGKFINNLLITLNSAMSTIDFSNIGAKIGQMLTDAFRQIDWNQYKQLLLNGFMAVWETLTGFASSLPPFQGIDFSAMTESLRNLWQSLWDFLEPIGAALSEAYNTVLKPLVKWAVEDAAPASVDGLSAALDALSAICTPVINGIVGIIAGLKPGVDFIKDIATIALKGLGSIIEEVGKAFGENGGSIQDVLSAVGKAISNVWIIAQPRFTALKEMVSAVLGFISDRIGISVRYVLNALGGITQFLTGVFAGDWDRAWGGIVKIFNGTVDAIKGTVNSVIKLINGLISGVCSGVNTIIKAMNKISFDIPNWDIFGSMAGKKFGFNLSTITAPKIPQLAKGAVVDQPTVAMIGEAGKEIVMPLENNTGAITQLAQKINQQGGGSAGSLNLAIYFRSRKLAEYVIQDINQITKENGVCPIYV